MNTANAAKEANNAAIKFEYFDINIFSFSVFIPSSIVVFVFPNDIKYSIASYISLGHD